MGLSLTEYQELLGKVRGTQLVYLEDMRATRATTTSLDRHVADEEANPLAQLQDQRMREALVEAIKLPEREQYVMSMYYEHDMNPRGDRGGAQGHRVARLPAAQPVDRAPARETPRVLMFRWPLPALLAWAACWSLIVMSRRGGAAATGARAGRRARSVLALPAATRWRRTS